MARLTGRQLDIIKDKFGVKDIYSYSRVNSHSQCSWQYFLKYVKRIRVRKSNCWGYWGNISHDIIQDFYERGRNNYELMASQFSEKAIEYSLSEDKEIEFPDEKQRDSYLANMEHYFDNVKPIEYDIVSEKPVITVLEGKNRYVFQGYIDAEYVDDEGNLYILDFKTSSSSGFSGKKLLENSRQLMIYAMGINQNGRMVNGEMRQFPIENIRIRYDLMKYVNVSFLQKNGKTKTTRAERRNWVAKIANQLRKDFEDVEKTIEGLAKKIKQLERKSGFKKTTDEERAVFQEEINLIKKDIDFWKERIFDSIELNAKIENAINSNSLSDLPQFIQDKYTLSDCYIDVELSEDIVSEYKVSLINELDEIEEKTKAEDKNLAFNRKRIGDGDSFFCVNLCDMKDHCKFYEDFQQHQAMFLNKEEEQSDEDILLALGLD